VHAYNGGPVPIVKALLHNLRPDASLPSQVLGQKTSNGYAIAANSSTSVAIERGQGRDANDLYVEFIDGHGRQWLRILGSGKYIYPRRFRASHGQSHNDRNN
jgi:hypothetical protein